MKIINDKFKHFLSKLLENVTFRSLHKKIKFLWNHTMRFFDTMTQDNVSGYASEATLFTIISLFPFVMLMLTFIQYTPLSADFVVNLFGDSLPLEITDFITKVVNEVFNTSTTVLSISAVAALWASSRGFLSIEKGLNVVYKTGETRNYFIIRFISVLYTLGFAVLLMLTLLLLVFGNYIFHWIVARIPWVTDIALLIMGIRAIVLLGLLFFYFLLMYLIFPNRKTSLFHELPGAIVSSAGWVGFSYVYSFYIDNMANYSTTYGSLTAIVLLMLWVYSCMYILFVGAEINVSFGKKIAKFYTARKIVKANQSTNASE